MKTTHTILTIALLLATQSAFADRDHNKGNTNKAVAVAVAGAKASSSTNVKTSQTTTYNEAKQDYSETYDDYTPSAYAPSINSTTPCLIAITGGVGVAGFNAGLGSGVTDKDCVAFETIRLGMSSQNPTTRNMADAALQTRLIAVMNEDVTETAIAAKKAQTTLIPMDE